MRLVKATLAILIILTASCGGGRNSEGEDEGKEPAPRFTSQANAVDILDPTRGLLYQGECSRNVDGIEIFSMYTPEIKKSPVLVFHEFDLSCAEDGFFFFVVRKSDLHNAGLVFGTKARVVINFSAGGVSTGILTFTY